MLTIEEPRLNPNDPSLAVTLSNLGGMYVRRKQFAEAERLSLRVVEIMKTAHGEASGEYGIALSNLGALYNLWADEPGETARRGQAQKFTTEALTVIRAARGARHPDTATGHSNLNVTKAKRRDWSSATLDLERALAIMLSLDLSQHPDTLLVADHLVKYWQRSSQSDKAVRLAAGDISDLVSVIARIEAEHRAWVADDRPNRRFGPSSFFEPKNENELKQWLSVLTAAGVDTDDIVRRIKARQLSLDDFASLVTDALVGKKSDFTKKTSY